MRTARIIGLFMAALLLSACAGRTSPAKEAASPPKVVEITDQVQRGRFGLITVQSEPRLDCAFSTEIKLATGKTDRSSDETATDANGKAYWSWLVHPGAVSGDYDLRVECGGKATTTRYTVQ